MKVNVDSVNVPAHPMLTAAQAAGRLGVKQETLYAYVSRGAIARERHPDGSRFDPLEVERFARARRTVTRGAPTAGGVPLTVIDTDIALIEDGELYFRGRPAGELARTQDYEAVLQWLLGEDEDTAGGGLVSEGPATQRVGEPEDAGPERRGFERRAPERGGFEAQTAGRPGFGGEAESLTAALAVVAAMPASATLRDLLQVAVTTLGACDPLRFDLREENVVRAAPALVAGMVDALPALGSRAARDARLAARLWPALTAQAPTSAGLDALNAALVLLVDHDMAVSSLAARAAASARANIYAVVSSGLGALDSALHGNASAAAHALIIGVGESGRAEQVVGEWIRRTGRGVPGFGHVLYSGRDPRATALLALLASVPGAERTMAAAQATIDVVTGRTGAEPNIDFALAALTVASGMRADAGEAVFAVARTGGWIIHALAEYRMPPLRLRPVGRYVGP